MRRFFERTYKSKSDSELEEIIRNSEKYVPEALEAAIAELKARSKFTKLLEKEIEKNQLQTANEYEKINFQSKRKKKRFRLLKSIFRFLVKPDIHKIQTDYKTKLLLVFHLGIILFLSPLITRWPLFFLEVSGVYTETTDLEYIPEYVKSEADIFVSTILLSSFAGFFEEVQYRLVLTNYRKKFFDIFLALCLSEITYRFFIPYIFIPYETYSSFLIESRILLILFFPVFYYSLSKNEIYLSVFSRNWGVLYPYFFYSLAGLFALGHLPIFQLSDQQLPFFIFYAFPFFAYAIIFSYARVRLGFWYAVLLHFTYDFIIFFFRYN